ncbi:hypothetical protein FRX31_028703, partial [Thalictrum thalictroides]
KGKEGGSAPAANPTAMITAPKITHQNGPVYKATGNLFASIPSGNLDPTPEIPTQVNKNTGNTQPHTTLMLSNAFDVLNENNTDNTVVIQPASIETTQDQITETAVIPHTEKSNAPSTPSTP